MILLTKSLRSRRHSTDAGIEAMSGDKYSFLVIFLIGAAGIIALRSYLAAVPVLGIIWAVVWMLIYAALVVFVPRFRLRYDQAGDNLYYLGFLYTLTSLSVALLHFTYQDIAIQLIISNFGIALFTTILGIALRVVLHQMREDPLDTEHDARISLAEATNRLRAELDASVQQMNAFSRETRQSIEEALHEIGQTAGRFLQDSSRQVAEVATNASTGIEEAFSAYVEHTKSLNAAARRQIQATEKLIDRIDAVEVPADLIDRKIAPAIERIAAFADGLARRDEREAKASEQLTEAITGMSRLTGELERQVMAMRQNVEASSAFADQIAPVAEKLQSIDRALDAAVDVMNKLTGAHAAAVESQETLLREKVDTLEQMRAGMARQIEEFDASLREVREASVRQTLEAMRGLAHGQKETYDILARETQETLATLRQSRIAVESEVSRARAATEQVMQQLTSMVRTLAHELGAPDSSAAE